MTASGWPWAEIAAVYAVGSLVTAWLASRITRDMLRTGIRTRAWPDLAALEACILIVTVAWPLYWAAVAWRSLRDNRKGAR